GGPLHVPDQGAEPARSNLVDGGLQTFASLVKRVPMLHRERDKGHNLATSCVMRVTCPHMFTHACIRPYHQYTKQFVETYCSILHAMLRPPTPGSKAHTACWDRLEGYLIFKTRYPSVHGYPECATGA